MSFIKKHIELFIIAALALSIMLKYFQIRVGDGLSIILAATLSFYYLASAILTFMDKMHIERLMRLIYFIGLWAVAFGILGIVARIHLWEVNRQMLIISISSCIAILLFVLLQQQRLRIEELRSAFKREIRPLIVRSSLTLLACVIIYFSTDVFIYQHFGNYRNDPEYIRLLQVSSENPKDKEAKEAFRSYHQEKLLNEKNDIRRSPKEN